jgi:hypothetical protein
MPSRVRAAALAALCTVVAPCARAQGFAFTPAVQPEWHADVVVAREAAAYVGAGLNVPAGYYARLVATAVAGRTADGASAARLEESARFLVDPFHEERWGPFAAAGIGVDWRDHERARPYLALSVGADLPSRGGWVTAVEAGIGGGARIGVTIRRARRTGR